MTLELLQTTLSATSDEDGNISFTLLPPGAPNITARYTAAVIEAGAGARFIAQVAAGPQWGPWFGPQPFGPITHAANLTAKILGSGLRVSTDYTCEILGYTDDSATVLGQPIPTPTGVTALVGGDDVYTNEALTIPAHSSVVIPGSGAFPCAGYSALRLGVGNASDIALELEVVWLDPTQTFQLGYRQFVLGPYAGGPPNPNEGQKLGTAIPHLGDFFYAVLTNPNANPATVAIVLEQTTQPFQMWAGTDLNGASAVTLAASGTNFPAAPNYLFGGPAQILFNGGTLASWLLILQRMDSTGTWRNIASRTSGGSQPQVFEVPFIAPAVPLRVSIENTGGSPGQFDCYLAYDLARVG